MEISSTINKVISEIICYYYKEINKVDPEDYYEISRLSCEMSDDIEMVRYLETYVELSEKVEFLKFTLSYYLQEEIGDGCYEERNNNGLEL